LLVRAGWVEKQFQLDLKDLNTFRSKFQLIMKSFDSISKYRSVKVIVDVDPN